jgi:hypothetical protein
LKILQSQFVLATSARMVYALTLSEGQTYEELFKPETWAHVARHIQPGFKVEVMPEDGSFYAELLVRAASNLEVTVAELFRVNFGEIEERDEEQHEIKWAGPKARYRVSRKADKAVIKDGFETAELAAEWLKTAA